MSRDDLQDAVSRWLREEGAGRDLDAETALATVFSALPALVPPAGFADRVLARAGIAAPLPAPFAAPAWLVRLGRALAAASLILAGLAALLLPFLLPVLGGALSLGRGVEWLAAGLLAACHTLVEALNVWDALAGVMATVGSLALRPTVLGMFLVALLVVATLLKGLHGWLVADRSSRHAQ